VSGFSAEWLALREPHDAAARSAELVALLARPTGRARALGASALARGAKSDAREAQPERAIVDLGAGSGANLRWLAPRLGGRQSWLLVDRDDALLAAVEPQTQRWAEGCGAQLDAHGAELVVRGATFECRARRVTLDLAAEVARLELPERSLVTSSALLDLVSAEWVDELARLCRGASADVLFALTYDGRSLCTPAEPEDAEALDLFNRHQRTDKGFGAALGPAAARRAAEALERLGYRVTERASDWRIGPGGGDMQRALLDGWLEAALEIAPRRRAVLEAWHRRRTAHVDAERSELAVGHVDLVGLAPERRSS
jgi:hypothetical protein